MVYLVGPPVEGLEVLVEVPGEGLAERSGEARVEVPVVVVVLVKCPSEVLAQLLGSGLMLVEVHESSPAEEYAQVLEALPAGDPVKVPEVFPVGVLVGDPGSGKGLGVMDVSQ